MGAIASSFSTHLHLNFEIPVSHLIRLFLYFLIIIDVCISKLLLDDILLQILKHCLLVVVHHIDGLFELFPHFVKCGMQIQFSALFLLLYLLDLLIRKFKSGFNQKVEIEGVHLNSH